MLKPKPFTLTDMDGVELTVILTRFPATVGREIAAKYPMSNLPKIGDYKVSEETAGLLMKYVFVERTDEHGAVVEGLAPLALSTVALRDNHTHDAETHLKIEMAMLEYNFSFFQKGLISDFFGTLVQMTVAKIIEMSNPSSEPSSTPKSAPSMN